MRNALSLLCLACAFAIAAGPASAQTPGRDSVVGTATAIGNSASWDFEIDLRSGPSGENPAGQLVARGLGGFVDFGGSPTCLAVRGNVATANILDTLGAGFGVVTVQVTDEAVDLVDVTLGREPGDCSPLTDPIVTTSVRSGDLVVTDAPPLPTAKDQCKNGGWRDFGVFKNQGDCVSFVATKGKNQPAG
jgi:hypothetical protein